MAKTRRKTTRHWHMRKVRSGIVPVVEHPMHFWGVHIRYPKPVNKTYFIPKGSESEARRYAKLLRNEAKDALKTDGLKQVITVKQKRMGVDSDGDGIPDAVDCQPYNPKKQDTDFSGHNFSFRKEGGKYKVSLGNMSDAGWYWSGDEKDLAGYFIRLTNSRGVDKEFIEGAKKEGLTYADMKKDVVEDAELGDGVYEMSGDNVRWKFGEGTYNDEIDFDEVAKSSGVDAKEFENAYYDHYNATDYDDFAKSPQSDAVQKKITEAFKKADTFEDVFQNVRDISENIMYDVIDYDNEKSTEAIGEALDELQKPKRKK